MEQKARGQYFLEAIHSVESCFRSMVTSSWEVAHQGQTILCSGEDLHILCKSGGDTGTPFLPIPNDKSSMEEDQGLTMHEIRDEHLHEDAPSIQAAIPRYITFDKGEVLGDDMSSTSYMAG